MSALTDLARYLVVSMDDTPAPAGAELLRLGGCDPDRLPLSAARNAAVEHLADCELVVLLDVDCIPSPALVSSYRRAAEQVSLDAAVLMGPVGWLDEPVTERGITDTATERARSRGKRAFPDAGVARECTPELFWSLSFALSPRAHRAVGGFDEAYAGWGAEDTDFGRRAHRRGVGLWKVAGAWAYHQPHPPARSRAGQVRALAQNAIRFHARWGDWPMPDVLGELADAGHIAWSPGAHSITIPAEG